MPSTETKVGVINGYEPDEKFLVTVETDKDERDPKYVYVHHLQTGRLETSFYFGYPPENCALSRAAAILAGSHGHYDSVEFQTVIAEMDEVIDWEDTAKLRNGRRRHDQTDWSLPTFH